MHLKRCTIAAIALCLLARPCIAQDDPEIRELAEGVLTTIPLSAEDGETLTGPIPLVEVVNGIPDLDWTPNYAPKTRTLFEKAKHDQKAQYNLSVDLAVGLCDRLAREGVRQFHLYTLNQTDMCLDISLALGASVSVLKKSRAA